MHPRIVIPAKAGTQSTDQNMPASAGAILCWIPACAGMTIGVEDW